MDYRTCQAGRTNGMTTREEQAAISSMLKKATVWHLEAEVLLAFYYTVRANPDRDLNESIFIALYEWDV